MQHSQILCWDNLLDGPRGDAGVWKNSWFQGVLPNAVLRGKLLEVVKQSQSHAAIPGLNIRLSSGDAICRGRSMMKVRISGL